MYYSDGAAMKLTHNIFIRSPFFSRGLSLIELMVALAISAILMLGVATVFLGSKRGYQVNTEVAALQENARFALHTLTTEIRNAGYSGCGSLQGKQVNMITRKTLPNDAIPGFELDGPLPPPGSLGRSRFNINTHVTGHEIDGGGNAAPAFDSLLGIANIEPNTSAITIRKVSACSARVTAVAPGQTTVTNNCNFTAGDIVMVTDCDKYDLVSLSGAAPAGADMVLTHNNTDNVQNTLSMAPADYFQILISV